MTVIEMAATNISTALEEGRDFVEEMDVDKDTLDTFYQFPEILTQQQLLDILRKRSIVRGSSHCALEKDELIRLFREYVVPLPQRMQLKNRKETRKPNEMLRYIKHTAVKRKSDSVPELGRYAKEKKFGREETQTNSKEEEDISKKMKNFVCISAKGSEQKRKPVKLNRKRPKNKDDRLLIKTKVEPDNSKFLQEDSCQYNKKESIES